MKPGPPLVVARAEVELGGKGTTPARGLNPPPAPTTRGRVAVEVPELLVCGSLYLVAISPRTMFLGDLAA